MATPAMSPTQANQAGRRDQDTGPNNQAGKRTLAGGDATTISRADQLIASLEKQFVRNPAAAKQTATDLSVEFPDRFDARWLVEIIHAIDEAAWRKDQIAKVHACWDDRPAVAKAAIAQLVAKYRSDTALKRWAAAMTKRIDEHQLRLRLQADLKLWDRKPSVAQAAARELHAHWPREYKASWLRQIEGQIWNFQDVKWGEKIGEAELRDALGENWIDAFDAPPEVMRELRIRLGRQLANQRYGASGKGAADTSALVQTDASRADAMSGAAAASPGYSFTSKENLPVKRLDLTAKAYEQKANELDQSMIAMPKQDDKPDFLRSDPDAFLAMLDKVITDRAQYMRDRGQAYADLKLRIDRGETTLARERSLMQNDIDAMFDQRSRLNSEYRSIKNDIEKNPEVKKKADQLQQAMDSLDQQITATRAVIANGDVLPGAGAFAQVFPPINASMSAPTNDGRRQVNDLMRGLDKVTGDDPYQKGIGKNFNEIGVGLTRFVGRIQMFNAGVMRLFGDASARFLPESASKPIVDLAMKLRDTALAYSTANTELTAKQEASQQQYTNAGGTIPLEDRVLANQKLFEKPDTALLAILQAAPGVDKVTLPIQLTVLQMQTMESFFSEYGKSGSLEKSFTAAGYTLVSGAIGIVLDTLHVPATGQTIASVATAYIIGKMKGQTNEQIQEEIANVLIGAGIGAATKSMAKGGAARIVDVMEARAKAIADSAAAAGDPATAQKVVQLSNELDAVELSSREATRELQSAQKSGASTKEAMTKLEASVKLADAKRVEIRLLTEGSAPKQLGAGNPPKQLTTGTPGTATMIKKPVTALQTTPKNTALEVRPSANRTTLVKRGSTALQTVPKKPVTDTSVEDGSNEVESTDQPDD